ncbi:MAG: ATP-binding protein [Calditrichia bacterium]
MRKLTTSTLIWVLAFTLLILIAADYFVYSRTKAFIMEGIRNELSSKVSLAKSFINVDAFVQRERSELKQYANEIKSRTGLRTTLIDKQGEVIADSELPISELNSVENHINRPEIQKAMRLGSGLARRLSSTIDRNLIYYAEPLRENGRIVGFIRFAMFSPDMEARMSYLYSLLWRVNLILLIAAISGAYIYAVWLKNYFSKFLFSLNQQRESKTFQPLPHQPLEELDRISAEFNGIGHKLQQQINGFQDEKEELVNIFNSLKEGVAAFNNEGFLQVYNEPFLKIFNLDETEIFQRPFYDWLHFPPVIQDIDQFLNNRQPVQKRIKYYGDTYIEYQVLPLQQKVAAEDGFLVTVADVTHLHLLETIRQDFVSNVSHEFKTPLTSIRGYAETLLNEVGEDKTLIRKFLQKIEKQTLHLENLVSDVLQLSRVERNEITDIQPLDALPVLDDLAEDFETIARAKDLSFYYRKPVEEDKVMVKANPQLLQTLLSNLLMNSIQYNHKGGEILLKVDAGSAMLSIHLKDSGIGISAEEQQRIFERFYRTAESRHIYPEGSGLGLSIVKHIVQLLEGEIKVESTPGEGSTFILNLPRIAAA